MSEGEETYGERAAARLAAIAACSEPGEGVTRLPWTAEHRRALEHVRAWMDEAGLEAALDPAGTLVGRSAGDPTRPVLMLGSHQDSVRQGGAFDGIMGVALACLAVRRLKARHADLPVSLEVVAFADEEGVRFPSALIGPRALAGTLAPETLSLKDRTGVAMDAAMTTFGLDPSAMATVARQPAGMAGYLEVHIEQGPVLERAGLPVGVVTAICGISRHAVTVVGETGHAGTVPMEGRRDALSAAADFIAVVTRAARQKADLRATFGELSLRPNVVNAIPGRVALTLEIRAPEDTARTAFEAEVASLALGLAFEHRVSIETERTYAQPAVTCDSALRGHLERACADIGLAPLPLPSGATHDASAMADLCPVAMLFVRCRGGVSHRPDEHASAEDMGVAVDVLVRAIERVAMEADQHTA